MNIENYKRSIYTGQYGPYDYITVPSKEYTRELILELHKLPNAYSEWWSFYNTRFFRCNGFPEHLSVQHLEINVPIITREEMFNFGL
jgi:hypothetical protein